MVSVVEPLLGTRVEIEVRASSAATVARAEQAVIAEMQRLEAVFTVFDTSSDLHVFAATGVTDVPELAVVSDLALDWRQRTRGLFEPSIQPLMQRWDAAEIAGVPPTDLELAALVAAVDEGAIPDNLNAIAKGWIADHAATSITTDPTVDGVWVNAGGDVVHRGIGSLRVGVEDPRRPYDNAPPLAVVELHDEALATSGGTRRFWTIGGRRYSKVLDPRSGRPLERLRSASVIAADAVTADVLATVALVATVDETLSLASDADAACLLVTAEGEVVSTTDRFRAA